jgi:hypothetical protein
VSFVKELSVPRIILACLLLLVPFAASAADITITGTGTCTVTAVTVDPTPCSGAATATRSGGGAFVAGDHWIVDGGGRNTILSVDIAGTLGVETFQLWYCPDATGPPSSPYEFDQAGTTCVGSEDFIHSAAWMIEANQKREAKRILGTNVIMQNCAQSCGAGNTITLELTNAFEGIDVEPYKLICDPRGAAAVTCDNGTGASSVPISFRSDQSGVAPTSAPVMELAGDFTQNTTALAGITVEVGGTLQTGATPVAITLGPGNVAHAAQTQLLGLIGRGTVSLTGDWYSTETGATVTYVDDIDADVLYQVPEIVPCAVAAAGDITSNCGVAANREFIGLRWTGRYESTGTGLGLQDPHIQELVAAITTNIATDEALLSFPDLSLGTAQDLPNDFWGSYTIEAAGGGAAQPYYVIASVRSGDIDTPAYCFADRQDLQTGTTVGAWSFDRVQVSDTTLEGSTTDCGASALTTRELTWSGRFIRFRSTVDLDEDGELDWECQGYPIGHVIDDVGGDIVFLAGDPDSGDTLRKSYPAATEYVIDYGWKCGESIAFQRPTTIKSATTASTGVTTEDSVIWNQGDMTLRAVYTQGIGRFITYAPSATVDWSYMTVHDQVWNDTTGRTFELNATANVDLGPGIFVAGGSAEVGKHNQYIFHSIESGSVLLHDSQIRHHGDDALLTWSTSPGGGVQRESTDSFSVKNVKICWASEASISQSGSMLDIIGGGADVSVDGLYGCAPSTYDSTLNNLYVLGAYFGFGVEDRATSSANSGEGCTSSGSVFAHSISNETWGAGLLVPARRTSNWVVRDVVTLSSALHIINADTSRLENGYIKRFALNAQMRLPQGGDELVQNIGVFTYSDWLTAGVIGQGGPFNLTLDCEGLGDAADACSTTAQFKNITFASDVDFVNFGRGHVNITATGDVDQRGIWSDIALAGWTSDWTIVYAFGGFIVPDPYTDGITSVSGDWCGFANQRRTGGVPGVVSYRDFDTTPPGDAIVAALVAGGGSFTRNVDPQWYDSGRNQFWPVTGSPWDLAGCGMSKGTGVPYRMLGHKVLDLQPDYQGEGTGGGGEGQGSHGSW